jgi:branched-chain amino acid transport system permease protein
MGFRYGLFAFTAAVLGGIGNLNGAVLGGLIIGLVWQMSDGFLQNFIPWWGAQWTPLMIFGVLVLVMIFKPAGLLGEAVPEKV